ncbi:MAG: hypothetical protein BroJett011_20760 [Chloroflexota bacterium]|nr:MAG: hypothetical protein BroJett011_20760 [Chloroflexota bacterium]
MKPFSKIIIVAAWALVLIALLALLLLMSPPARAAGPWYVGPSGSDGNTCLSPAARCATINGALNKPGFVASDTVRVAIGTYTGTGTEVVLLNKNATLSGGWDSSFTTQSGMSTIDGQGARRGVTVDNGITVTVDRFIIQNGSASDGGGINNNGGVLSLNNSAITGNTASDFGGGIINAGALVLNHSSISGNTTTSSSGGAGGGIWNSGTLTLNDSIVNGNTSGWHSGGIYNIGSLTLNGSTISDNTARSVGGILNNSDYGGGTATLNNSAVNGNTANIDGSGIYNSFGGFMTLNNSTVSGNIASGDTADRGGGIFNYGTMTLNNSTVSNNRLVNPSQSITSRGGGGIFSSGTLNLNNSTISGNSFSGFYSTGGGLYNLYGGPYGNNYMTLQNTIVAGNTASSGPDCAGYVNSTGYNLIENPTGCTFTPTTGDLTNIDPKLGPLTGSPAYHPLLFGSPAINAGNPAGCMGSAGLLTTDQRGFPRVGRCDIGAYEFGLTITKQAVGNYQPGSSLTYIVTFHNESTSNISGMRLTDTLPISLTYVPGSFSATSGAGGESGGVITWNGSVPAGSNTTISFRANIDANVPSCTLITNKALVSSGTGTGSEIQITGTTPCVCNLTKATSNPVLSIGANGSWDDAEVWEPTVLKEGNVYKMWYLGYDGATSRIGYATSANGLTWTKHPGNPILSPGQSWEGSRVIAPSVISDTGAGLYKMWYTGIDSSGVSRIGYATSPDGVNWTKYSGNPVLNPGAGGSWEDEDVRSPAVLKVNSVYHMWYAGDDGTTIRIGHATSSDGLNWTKDPANPVLDVGPSGGWDWLDVYGPSVIQVGTNYQLWYSGKTLPEAWQTGYALSPNGSNWTRHALVIPKGPTGAFDDDSADYPTVIADGNTFKIWYSGFRNGGTYNIGYATAQVCGATPAPPVTPVYLPIVQKGGGGSCPVYYSDNFSNPDSGWPVSDNSQRKFGYVGGQYQIWVKIPFTGWSVTPGAKATDFTAAVSARRASGSGGGYGIIFGINEDFSQWYEFDIGSNNYSIWKYNNGYTPLRNWTVSPHIKTGTSWNRLKVIRSGTSIAVYVNNQALVNITDGSFTGLRRIGLTAGSSNAGLDTRFDDFSLFPASCGVGATETGFEMGEPGVYEAPALPGLEE